MIATFTPSDKNPGLPRYENDDYRRSDSSVSGNFWFITTLWHAQYKIEKDDITGAMAILDWVKSYALSTGMLSEQIDPATGRVIAPAPLTWSHAEYISTVLDLIERR
jgi:GH15 family glucan-1,4-alpha-glucosidase